MIHFVSSNCAVIYSDVSCTALPCQGKIVNFSKKTCQGKIACLYTGFKRFLSFKDVKSDTVDKLSEELKNLGCNCWRTKLGGEGVSVHDWTVH